MIRGDYLNISEENLNKIEDYLEMIMNDDDFDMNLSLSEYFRKNCLNAGFKLLYLYPCYHQGWELDEWGAVGIKDGKKYRLETNHGSLRPELMPSLLDIIVEKYNDFWIRK